MSKNSFLASLLSLFSLSAFGQKKDTIQTHELQAKIKTLKTSMISYIKRAKPSYTKKEVDACVSILNKYVDKLSKTNSNEEGMKIVKSTVLKLNELNDKCDSELIETEEREQIAEIIIIAGNKKGYNTMEEDITEEWREW